jgi:mRNA-degrading endonuclease YafQ of YafQ-DinJ toxin-antitoxin module
MYKLVFADSFWKIYKTIVKKNFRLKKKIVKVFKQLALDPKHSSLKSHKVASKKFGERWASKITGDLRIIWDYSKDEELTILVLSLGGHSGKRKAYK